MPSMVGIVGRAPAVDEKVYVFVCLFVTLWNYEVFDNGNAMKQCNFYNNYGTVAWRKVSSCAPIFKFLYEPPGFFSYRQIYGDFGCHKATFLKPHS